MTLFVEEHVAESYLASVLLSASRFAFAAFGLLERGSLPRFGATKAFSFAEQVTTPELEEGGPSCGKVQ